MEQGHPSHVPKGRDQAGQMGREKCHQLTSSGENSPWSYFLIREEQINGSFTLFSCSDHPSSHIPACAHPVVPISWHRAPDTPRFPSLASHQHPAGREKTKAPVKERDVAPVHPLLSSLCHEGLHNSPQTRVGISSPKTPNLAWARAPPALGHKTKSWIKLGYRVSHSPSPGLGAGKSSPQL